MELTEQIKQATRHAGEATYKFRWPDVDLEAWLDGMRRRANELRCKASLLQAQAEMIDEERRKLSLGLLPVEEN